MLYYNMNLKQAVNISRMFNFYLQCVITVNIDVLMPFIYSFSAVLIARLCIIS
jgi:hypothetical protein